MFPFPKQTLQLLTFAIASLCYGSMHSHPGSMASAYCSRQPLQHLGFNLPFSGSQLIRLMESLMAIRNSNLFLTTQNTAETILTVGCDPSHSSLRGGRNYFADKGRLLCRKLPHPSTVTLLISCITKQQ